VKEASDMQTAFEPPPLDPRLGPVPSARFLSNGRYRVLVTAAGTGSSSFDAYALTPWGGDRLEDADGFFFYLRDLGPGTFWRLGYRVEPDSELRYQARWQPGSFEIVHEENGIEARLEICVPPDATLELRRLTLVNRSRQPRRIELTTYAEVVLHDAAAHAAHPAFSKLFVQTEFVPRYRALLARRRPRAAGEAHPWLVHARLDAGESEHETDRARFLGRCPPPRAPVALASREPLSGTTGDVLDPIVSLRSTFLLRAGEQASHSFVLGAAPGRAEALALVHRFAARGAVETAFERSRSHALDELRRLDLQERQAEYLQALGGAALFGHPGLRAADEVLRRGRGPLEKLARYGVSARRALVLLHAAPAAAAEILPDLRLAHRYWKALGLPIDLVVSADVSPADLDGLEAVARVIVTDTLPDLVGLTTVAHDAERIRIPNDAGEGPSETIARPRREEALEFFNGQGGFASDGSEYVIRLQPDGDSGLVLPPRPWINVVANEQFGFLVSETGAGYTWSRNSREHRLTPWSNDPVLDPHGEALYIRDEEDARAHWSPLPGPIPYKAPYEMRHGFGYSRCHHASHGLEQETLLFVPRDAPLSITVVRLTNTTDRTRRLSLFAYRRLVLGSLPEDSARFVVTERDDASKVLLARNPMSGEFADGVVFSAVIEPPQARSVYTTCDRESFIGRGGSPSRPAGPRDASVLDGRTGAGLDPCMAHQVVLELSPGESTEVGFLFGEAGSTMEARSLVERYRAPGATEQQFDDVRRFWTRMLRMRVETPSRALDVMINGWLPYQDSSCRLWGRSAFYQSGGAFGFRDQLQDAAALVYLAPDLSRAQLLLHAGHQFVEGDVLHWWHPPLGRGIRTRFADDLLWLPFVTASYVATTGDWGILDESARFLTARPLEAGEDEAYLLPEDSGESADLYEHCCRALDRSLKVGAHGLPLFGTGDWNDGMNRVGREGRGESVWMGFFLVSALRDFEPLCERRGDGERARRYRTHCEQLRVALNEAGWDGEWYRRGYYDSGALLGSKQSDECRIDALAQAWAVLSGVAPPERAVQAMDAVERHLISKDAGIIQLLAPPFEHTPNDPGYIQGYPPGVRENGGQYTHAALWVVAAMAALGRNDRVAALLEMLGPVSHTLDAHKVAVYQVEPYVVAADVYSEPPHIGRGGWTWYTGSAGWMYRVALESLLGFKLEAGETLLLEPCIPDDWPRFSLMYRLPGDETQYKITAINPEGCARRVVSASIDGRPARIECGAARIPLERDGRVHKVEVVLGPKDGAGP
jgi:cyclic beta-1,2-glucan synthetase